MPHGQGSGVAAAALLPEAGFRVPGGVLSSRRRSGTVELGRSFLFRASHPGRGPASCRVATRVTASAGHGALQSRVGAFAAPFAGRPAPPGAGRPRGAPPCPPACGGAVGPESCSPGAPGLKNLLSRNSPQNGGRTAEDLPTFGSRVQRPVWRGLAVPPEQGVAAGGWACDKPVSSGSHRAWDTDPTPGLGSPGGGLSQ